MSATAHGRRGGGGSRLAPEGPGGLPALLEARGIRVDVPGRTILDVDRLRVDEGELLAVLGPNGSGKTTLLHVLAGLREPDGGTVLWRGQPDSGRRAFRRRAAVVFQRPHVWEGTVARNLELGLRLHGVPRAERGPIVVRIARRLGLEPFLDADARRLSGGEVQRLAIGRALALEPDVLFLDEPTANLDADVRRELRELLDREARSDRRAVVLATHDRAEAFYLADRIAVLREGVAIRTGSPAALFENPGDPFVAGVTGAELSVPGRVETCDGTILRVRIGEGEVLGVGRARPGDAVRVAYRPEDLLILADPDASSSARNRFPAVVEEVRSVGGLLRLRLRAQIEWVAIVTRAAAEELHLRPGALVTVHIKATALHVFPR